MAWRLHDGGTGISGFCQRQCGRSPGLAGDRCRLVVGLAVQEAVADKTCASGQEQRNDHETDAKTRATGRAGGFLSYGPILIIVSLGVLAVLVAVNVLFLEAALEPAGCGGTRFLLLLFLCLLLRGTDAIHSLGCSLGPPIHAGLFGALALLQQALFLALLIFQQLLVLLPALLLGTLQAPQLLGLLLLYQELIVRFGMHEFHPVSVRGVRIGGRRQGRRGLLEPHQALNRVFMPAPARAGKYLQNCAGLVGAELTL